MREIKTIGEEILKTMAKEVELTLIKDKMGIVDEMVKIMRANKGVGIAAPQVGVAERIVVIEIGDNERYPNVAKMPLTIMINPQIYIIDGEKEDGYEGCLSVPGIRGLVPRYKRIKVDYINEKGEAQIKELEGFPARVAQHEIDHLNGIVFIERVEDKKSFITDENYSKFILKDNQRHKKEKSTFELSR